MLQPLSVERKAREKFIQVHTNAYGCGGKTAAMVAAAARPVRGVCWPVLLPFLVIQLAAVRPQELVDCSDSKLKRTLPTPAVLMLRQLQ